MKKFDPAEYVNNAGWDFSCIQATAEMGVSDEDERILEEQWPDDLEASDDLLAYCRRRVAAAEMGSAKTTAKAAAARENGRKGGRPRKIQIFGGNAARQRAEEYAEKHGGHAYGLDNLGHWRVEEIRAKFGLGLWNNNSDGVVFTHVVLPD